MRVEARYEDGVLVPERPLPLRAGERVRLILVRRSDLDRWDLNRLATATAEDEALALAALDLWADALDEEDKAESSVIIASVASETPVLAPDSGKWGSSLDLAASLELKGPEDWSRNLDDYLYGGKSSE